MNIPVVHVECERVDQSEKSIHLSKIPTPAMHTMMIYCTYIHTCIMVAIPKYFVFPFHKFPIVVLYHEKVWNCMHIQYVKYNTLSISKRPWSHTLWVWRRTTLGTASASQRTSDPAQTPLPEEFRRENILEIARLKIVEYATIVSYYNLTYQETILELLYEHVYKCTVLNVCMNEWIACDGSSHWSSSLSFSSSMENSYVPVKIILTVKKNIINIEVLKIGGKQEKTNRHWYCA